MKNAEEDRDEGLVMIYHAARYVRWFRHRPTRILYLLSAALVIGPGLYSTIVNWTLWDIIAHDGYYLRPSMIDRIAGWQIDLVNSPEYARMTAICVAIGLTLPAAPLMMPRRRPPPPAPER